MNTYGSKHLTKSERKLIERFLNDGLSCKEIAERLDKDQRTVSKEVKKRRNRVNNGKYSYDSYYNSGKHPASICKVLTRFPYVCNACHGNSRHSCRQEFKYFYEADLAQENYEIILSDSRTGLDITLEEKVRFDTILKNGIEKGQSIHHICQTNDLPYSERSAYRLVDKQQTTVQSIDLRRKVKLKPRKHYEYREDNREIREGRRYLDFLAAMATTPSINVTELDTVVATRSSGHKCLLTIHSTATHFMLIYVLDEKDKSHISNKLRELQSILGVEDFRRFFNISLTDRGTEFCDPYAVEVDESTGEKIASLFYCNSYSSYQKGALEENHEFIRYIIPKGTLFDHLTQEQANLMASHINSYYRKSIDGCPYDLAVAFFGEELIKKLEIRKVAPDLIDLTSNLVKYK